jgi:hypothetical protein
MRSVIAVLSKTIAAPARKNPFGEWHRIARLYG